MKNNKIYDFVVIILSFISLGFSLFIEILNFNKNINLDFFIIFGACLGVIISILLIILEERNDQW